MKTNLQKIMFKTVVFLAFAQVADAAKRNEPLFPQCNIAIEQGRTQSPCSVSEFAQLWYGEKVVIPTQWVSLADLKLSDGYSYSNNFLQVLVNESVIGRLEEMTGREFCYHLQC